MDGQHAGQSKLQGILSMQVNTSDEQHTFRSTCFVLNNAEFKKSEPFFNFKSVQILFISM